MKRKILCVLTVFVLLLPLGLSAESRIGVRGGAGILHVYHTPLDTSSEKEQKGSGGTGITLSLDYDLFLTDHIALNAVADISGNSKSYINDTAQKTRLGYGVKAGVSFYPGSFRLGAGVRYSVMREGEKEDTSSLRALLLSANLDLVLSCTESSYIIIGAEYGYPLTAIVVTPDGTKTKLSLNRQVLNTGFLCLYLGIQCSI